MVPQHASYATLTVTPPFTPQTIQAVLSAFTHMFALISMSAFSCSGSTPVKSMPAM